MPTPEKHALLSASSSERWLHCTKAPLLEATFPETTSEFAEEGRMAHSVAELFAQKKFSVMSQSKFNAERKKLETEELYSPEMAKHAQTYVDALTEEAMRYENTPLVLLEKRVDFSNSVPEGFGTADCIMIGGDCITVCDYKYGQGVPVDAVGNTQMRLYALGALSLPVMMFYGPIRRVRMRIIQPRINNDSAWEITRDELDSWTRKIKPVAQKAYAGEGDYCPGEWCRFCRAKNTCRARTYDYLALEAFGNVIPGEENPRLSDEEVGQILLRAKGLAAWVKDLEEYALKTVLTGGEIPGWKAVEGRSLRQWSDQDGALRALEKGGYPREVIYDTVPKSLSQLEKLVGKTEFAQLVGAFITKPCGKPTLVETSDKRPVYNAAVAAFGDANG